MDDVLAAPETTVWQASKDSHSSKQNPTRTWLNTYIAMTLFPVYLTFIAITCIGEV